MKKFKYRGYDSVASEVSGTLEAEDYREAYAALNFQGITVVTLESERLDFSKIFKNFLLKLKLGGRWQATFFRELSIILGVMTLHEALKTLMLAAQNHPSSKILSELVTAVGEGQSFSSALSKYDIIFGSDTIQSIEIGEHSGNIQSVTMKLAIQLERAYSTEKKVRSAMYYPLFVLLAAFIAAIVLLNVTLPVFENFFEQQGTNLPFLTLILLHGGKFLAEYWIFISMIIFFLITMFGVIIHKYQSLKFLVDEFIFKIKLFREVELRNFFGRLSFLLESGETLDEALSFCAMSTKNLYVTKILNDIKFSVERGKSFSSLLNKKFFPSLYIGLIVTGETGGELVDMLRQCERMADFEVDGILHTLPAKAEIFGTLIAGLIVATLVFAVMLPILDTTNLL